jgi:hypothetical protein
VPERTGCPFYGFHLAVLKTEFVLMDQSGNQCALRAGYAPCFMEIDGKAPVWQLCVDLNNRGNQGIVEQLRKKARIFPQEGDPKGMPFDRWFQERTTLKGDHGSTDAR